MEFLIVFPLLASWSNLLSGIYIIILSGFSVCAFAVIVGMCLMYYIFAVVLKRR